MRRSATPGQYKTDLLRAARKGSKRVSRRAKPKARQEGEAKGRQDGEAAITVRLLNRRCGPLSETTTAQIQALPVEKLEAMADALLDFQGPADLAAGLAGNS